MFIRTESLFLRPGWPEDLEELLQVLGDDAVVRGIGVAPLPRSVDELREFLARRRDRRLPHFFINLRDDNGARLIGGIGLGRSGEDVEMGYWIARPFRGQGYAVEAVKAVLAEARMLGHKQVIAAHFADNEASARVLERAGFKATGETSMRYSAGRGGEAPARLFVAMLSDKQYDLMGVGPQPAGA